MDLYQAIQKRRTVREFADRPVPEHIVRRVLEAGLRAPSNAHLKYWHFIRLRDREARERTVVEHLRARNIEDPKDVEAFVARFDDETLRKVYRKSLPLQLSMMLQAPELVMVIYRQKPLAECRTWFEFNPLASVWMCIENMVLAMAAEGLFGCTYTPYDSGELKAHLSVPDGYEVAAIIPFGYPLRDPGPGEEIPLGERLHIDHW